MLTSNPKGGAWRNLGRAAAVVALGATLATPAQAVRFKLADGAIDGSFDTTIGWGLNMRTEKAESPTNSLYGNRSVAKFEVFSNTVKASHDLSLTGDKWGVFIRGNYFYDFDADHEASPHASDFKEQQYDLLAAHFKANLDMPRLMQVLDGGATDD